LAEEVLDDETLSRLGEAWALERSKTVGYVRWDMLLAQCQWRVRDDLQLLLRQKSDAGQDCFHPIHGMILLHL
jgi:hypothetical protein